MEVVLFIFQKENAFSAQNKMKDIIGLDSWRKFFFTFNKIFVTYFDNG